MGNALAREYQYPSFYLMKRSYIVFCLLQLLLWAGLFSPFVYAQVPSRLPASLTRLFAQEMERQMRYAPEQIHLFTDREVYAAGDTIWFSGWEIGRAHV